MYLYKKACYFVAPIKNFVMKNIIFVVFIVVEFQMDYSYLL